jgi:hypothetical protein
VVEYLRVFRHVGFFRSWRQETFVTKGQERFLLARGKPPLILKRIAMKSSLAFILITALGVLTIGCDSQKGTSENKTVTTTTQSKDGKTASETTTNDTKTKTTTPPAGGKATEKTTETTTETTK